MNVVLRLLATLAACAAACLPATASGTPAPAVAPNFRLLDHRGDSHELHRLRPATAVVLFVVANGCPIVRNSYPELSRIRALLAPRGVEFFGLDLTADVPRAEVAAEAAGFSVPFPILLDPSQNLGRALDLRRTGEVLVIDTTRWEIVYRGAIDDRLSYGHQKPEPTRRHLADALDSLLAGRPVATPRTDARGCAIAYTRTRTPDYARDVAPILARHCVPCHSQGNVAPFAFTDHARVRRHSATVTEVLLEDRMPPWHADPAHGSFTNDRSLSPEQKATLFAWATAGAPRGDGPDPLPAAQPAPSTDWPLGRPDAVIGLPEPARIPATGLVPYQVFTVKAPVTNDTWLRGVTIRAGNPKVVHHCLVFIRYPEHLRHLEPAQEEGTAGFFAGFVPGTEPVLFPEGTGKLLPAGAELTFQMHYTPTGREETDRTEMALYFAPARPARELITGGATRLEIEIPAHARRHQERASFVFEQASVLHELTPHMHLRGAAFEYAAIHPDGRREVLLSVPNYDFNWQTLYRLRTPRPLPAGTRLECTATFDNSASNPANPDPAAVVRFGEQTHDEMLIGYFNYTTQPKPGS